MESITTCCVERTGLSILCYDEKRKYRSAITTEDVKAGQVVMCSRAVAYNLQSKFMSQKCHNCFKTHSNIMMCSKCKMSGYCSSECQRADWVSHKITCKMRNQIAALQLQSEQMLDNAMLLLKFCDRIKHLGDRTDSSSSSSSNGNGETCMDVNGTVICGLDHCLSMQVHNRKLDLTELNLIQMVAKNFEMNMSKVTNLYLAFESNNFGILDELLECVAAGVFPSTAIINHSCLPNCILRYRKDKNEAPIVEVVAITNIKKGVEITHSYVDCTIISGERKQKLFDIYKFDCVCDRCTSTGTIDEKLPTFFFEDIKDPIQLRKLLLDNAKEEVGIIAVQQDGQVDLNKVTMEAKQHSVEGDTEKLKTVKEALLEYHTAEMMAAQASSNCNDEGIHQNEIKNLLNVIKAMQEAFGEYNSDVYTLRGQLMHAYLLSGQHQLALLECVYIVNYLLLSYYTIPNHPLLGLQMFTLADLWEINGDMDKAQEMYRMSNEILTITHGKRSEMCSRLAGKLGIRTD